MGIPLVGYEGFQKMWEGAFVAQELRLFQTLGLIFSNWQFGYSKNQGCLKS